MIFPCLYARAAPLHPAYRARAPARSRCGTVGAACCGALDAPQHKRYARGRQAARWPRWRPSATLPPLIEIAALAPSPHTRPTGARGGLWCVLVCAVRPVVRAGRWSVRGGFCAPDFGGNSPHPTKRDDDTTRRKGQAMRAQGARPCARVVCVPPCPVFVGCTRCPREGRGRRALCPRRPCLARGALCRGATAASRRAPKSPIAGRKPRKRGFRSSAPCD